LNASVQAHDWRRTGEGKDARETQGQVGIGLEDGARGLQPLYGHDLLARVDSESRAAVKDKAAGKPIEQALGQLGFKELRAMSSSAPTLLREIDEAAFRSESPDAWNGKPSRRLVFEGNADNMPPDQRKYLREYKCVLTVWVGADGTPLASTRHVDLSGRAFVVVTFDQHSDQQRTFALAGDRLVTIAEEEKGHTNGVGDAQSYRTERTLQVLP
jgi:hypothetical protein